ncbi:hypothetical protein L3Q65_00335 (plasmid) [Amycolatopsis sp. FU40]|uniref:hypothetical protein n=1 Tax=Amycolatopsis sp. FU40 TaxID=2914159 RepID=UPI001F28B862|nr:hypothetical protein [Amycolatopsis sp. FU40]UKD50777.1 hypothetical protein L3Q65_00335 [Amycolatopsis sp. FU40]
MNDCGPRHTASGQTPAAAECPATRLTADQIAEMRERAGRTTSSFIDPAQLGRVERFVSGRHRWASAILGKPFRLRAMTHRELTLLDLAAHAEPAPPEPVHRVPEEPGAASVEPDRAAAVRAGAAAYEWARLAAALPVRASVAYNYSGPHHYEFHVSGADHIIVREPLHLGRLHRAAGRSLCWTPSRAKHLLFDLDDPTNHDRVPTCKPCLRTAYRIASLNPARSLLHSPELRDRAPRLR